MQEPIKTEKLIAKIHYISKTFIKRHYPEEEASFVVTWESFEEWIKQYKGLEAKILVSEGLLVCAQAGLGFAAEEGLDEKSKILIGTVSKTACDTQGKTLSLFKLTRKVEKVAAGTGANGEFLAMLIRHLPKLFADVQSANLEAPEAYVSPPAKPQYKIWTNGMPARIVDDYRKYQEKEKDEYLFRIDLDEKKHESSICSGKTIGPTAIELLIYLVERIGGRIPATDVLREVFENEPGGDKLDKYEKDQIQQQLRALQNFCGGQFREHLFPYKFNRGLGLQESFSNKYFIFTRLR